MKILITASGKSLPKIETLLKNLVGQDKWVKVETALSGTNQDPGIRGEEWLYYIRILSIDADGKCKVNYYNYDFPEQFSSFDNVAEVYAEDIDWYGDDTWGGILTTDELKELKKQRDEEHDQELRDYYGDDEEYDEEYDDDEV